MLNGQPIVTARACVLAGLIALSGAGCAPGGFLITPVKVDRALEEFVVARESALAERKIAVIDVDGLLSNRRSSSILAGSGENPVALFKEKLDKAAGDERVRALVLRINSPGGGVTASDLMHAELLRFKARMNKPVVACLLDVGASGAYYLACASDRILATPTSVVGSIGVVMLTPDLSGVMQKLGIEANVIKSGSMKDAGSPFRRMQEQERDYFQAMVNEMYERFLDVVLAGRPDLTRDQLRPLADGRVYVAPEAQRLGLIDEVGGMEAALLAARQAAGLADTPIVVVQYARPLAHRPNFYAQAADLPVETVGGSGALGAAGAVAPAQVNLIRVGLPEWMTDPSPQFLYLWAPTW